MGDIQIEIKEKILELNRGELVLICGKTGSGKTTLLKEILAKLKYKAGYVMQEPDRQIVNDLVSEELYCACECVEKDTAKINQKVAELASYFGISKWLTREVRTLSGGEKQILNLATAMAAGNQILLLDEPVAMLDPIMRDRIIGLIRNINREFMITVLIVEHTVEGLFGEADRIIVVDKGDFECLNPIAAIDRILEMENGNLMLPTYTRMFLSKKQYVLSMKEAQTKLPVLCEGRRRECPKGDVAIDVRKVSFAYEKHGEKILRETSISFNRGTISAVVGENGSGKSTLARLINGNLRPYGGKINRYGNKVGVLWQDVTLCFVKDEYKGKHPYDYSAGERQLLAIELVMDDNPDILVLDEPTKGLDGIERKKLAARLKMLAKENKAIILISHDMEFVAEIADNVSFIFNGEITQTTDVYDFCYTNMFYTTKAATLTRNIGKDYITVDEIIEAMR